MPYSFCSSKKCKNYQYFGEVDNIFSQEEYIQPKKSCGKCGSPMLEACPHCGSVRENMSNDFCPDCAKPYKQE